MTQLNCFDINNKKLISHCHQDGKTPIPPECDQTLIQNSFEHQDGIQHFLSEMAFTSTININIGTNMHSLDYFQIQRWHVIFTSFRLCFYTQFFSYYTRVYHAQVDWPTDWRRNFRMNKINRWIMSIYSFWPMYPVHNISLFHLGSVHATTATKMIFLRYIFQMTKMEMD